MRILYLLCLLPLLFGFSGNLQGGLDGKLGGSMETAEIIASMPSGLTFYADYTDGRNGINADWSLGDGTGYYTGTDGQSRPDLNGGYHATVKNKDVLKYKIAHNRTATQETIVIKFTITSNPGGGFPTLFSTDTKNRMAYLNGPSGGDLGFLPNQTDNGAIDIAGTSDIRVGNTVIATFICNSSGNPNNTVTVYTNNNAQGNSTTNWTVNAWGTYFYVGVKNDLSTQLNGIIQSVAFFNRTLSSNEVLKVLNLI